MDTIEAVLPRALQMSEIEMELKSHGNKKTTNMATDRKTAYGHENEASIGVNVGRR